jgi:hypothetical protein
VGVLVAGRGWCGGAGVLGLGAGEFFLAAACNRSGRGYTTPSSSLTHEPWQQGMDRQKDGPIGPVQQQTWLVEKLAKREVDLSKKPVMICSLR